MRHCCSPGTRTASVISRCPAMPWRSAYSQQRALLRTMARRQQTVVRRVTGSQVAMPFSKLIEALILRISRRGSWLMISGRSATRVPNPSGDGTQFAAQRSFTGRRSRVVRVWRGAGGLSEEMPSTDALLQCEQADLFKVSDARSPRLGQARQNRRHHAVEFGGVEADSSSRGLIVGATIQSGNQLDAHLNLLVCFRGLSNRGCQ